MRSMPGTETYLIASGFNRLGTLRKTPGTRTWPVRATSSHRNDQHRGRGISGTHGRLRAAVMIISSIPSPV